MVRPWLSGNAEFDLILALGIGTGVAFARLKPLGSRGVSAPGIAGI